MSKEAELALVIQSYRKASEWEANKQWSLRWRDADILYQAPRTVNTFEGTNIFIEVFWL